MMEGLKSPDIRRLLARRLVTTEGRSEAYWDSVIGEVEALPAWEHPNCNWRVAPSATGDDLFAISRAVELLRFEHPYVIDAPTQALA